MIFRSLEIKRNWWDNKLEGRFRVGADGGHDISIKVNEDLCQKLIDLCADAIIEVAIIEVATEEAEGMESKVIEGLKSKGIEARSKNTH